MRDQLENSQQLARNLQRLLEQQGQQSLDKENLQRQLQQQGQQSLDVNRSAEILRKS